MDVMPDDMQGRRVIDSGNCTVEYESTRHGDAVLLVPFPATDVDGEDTVLITGSIEDLRGMIDTMTRMIDSWEDEA